jgi:DNA-binding LytR/AlgR family response regulator
MRTLLRDPLPIAAQLAAAAAIAVAVALYCLAYTALAGRPEPPAVALVWAAVNVLPWFAAFELAKRFRTGPARIVVLGAAFALSLALDLALDPGARDLAFEAVRRVPALLIVVLLLAIGRRAVTPFQARDVASVELPLAPDQIDWVAAAGNYVEIRGRGRILIRRMPLGAVERELCGRGFVRIHRSRLVRRDRIAMVRPNDVILVDGTSLKTGKRYRSALTD